MSSYEEEEIEEGKILLEDFFPTLDRCLLFPSFLEKPQPHPSVPPYPCLHCTPCTLSGHQVTCPFLQMQGCYGDLLMLQLPCGHNCLRAQWTPPGAQAGPWLTAASKRDRPLTGKSLSAEALRSPPCSRGGSLAVYIYSVSFIMSAAVLNRLLASLCVVFFFFKLESFLWVN